MTKQYDRFFAFGCSYTEYPWPTWADIIGQAYKNNYYNFGLPGAGNIFIYHMVMQADEKHHFTDKDLIVVQWSGWFREDRYSQNVWRLHGYNHNPDFAEKYFDARGYLIRDLGLIKGVTELLNHRQCTYKFLALMPFGAPELTSFTNYEHFYADLKDVMAFYSNVLKKIPISYEGVFRKKDRPKLLRENVYLHDSHRTPLEHLRYIQHVIPELVPNDVSFVQSWEDRFSLGYPNDTSEGITTPWEKYPHDDWNDVYRGLGEYPYVYGIKKTPL